MTDGLFLTRAALESLFEELAVELDGRGGPVEILMVGGSWLLWFDQRDATRDVDSASRLQNETVAAVARVASRHDLEADWLNDNAVGFLPQGFKTATCTTVYEHKALVVRTPPPEIIFLMKLYRAAAPDREDMISLWPLCDFTGPADVVTRFFKAYPHAPEDPHLDGYVAAIVEDAGEP